MEKTVEQEIASSLKDILKLIRIQAMPSVRSLLTSALAEASHRRIYQALDGGLTQKQLAAMFKTSQSTVSRLVSSWQRVGIVEEVSVGKYLKSFNLESFGIDPEEGI
jgi:CRP-like cAMP-binding protein